MEDPHPVAPALELAGVRKTHDPDGTPVVALRGVDLRVERGEFVALMGPSGCGKSTLLQVAAGLEPADDGSVRLAGEELVGLSESAGARVRRRHVGFVFQFFNLLEGMSALENVALAALAAGAGRRAADARARELIDLLGLLDKARRPPAALSGGQRQRLAIARALANRPTLLLADEPTGALDSAGAQEILELFGRLHELGQTILLVTHSAEVAAGADRLVLMRDGLVDAPVREAAP
ncbi:putative ABC transport system ATP-binding protein [Motilibacter peucedani]|uniref:Putative ABC transport system ATP-binding protein n=1 Tax=Motilibacter peucedani TaxID=598650 RepID=A0A420XUM3_9ACTN|nr:ABC transporter ATP-binding protein [Motilibacter peucedani]RKS80528.1 putative ABC transport system ATP-binding protein [Motilibacter peucedani]